MVSKPYDIIAWLKKPPLTCQQRCVGCRFWKCSTECIQSRESVIIKLDRLWVLQQIICILTFRLFTFFTLILAANIWAVNHNLGLKYYGVKLASKPGHYGGWGRDANNLSLILYSFAGDKKKANVYLNLPIKWSSFFLIIHFCSFWNQYWTFSYLCCCFFSGWFFPSLP